MNQKPPPWTGSETTVNLLRNQGGLSQKPYCIETETDHYSVQKLIGTVSEAARLRVRDEGLRVRLWFGG